MLGCTREHNAESPLSKTETTEGNRIGALNSGLVFEPFWTETMQVEVGMVVKLWSWEQRPECMTVESCLNKLAVIGEWL